MLEMVLVIDESGAKGNAKTREKHPGEIGVMAAFLYPLDEMQEIENFFDIVLTPYKKPGKKLHITDLSPASQEKMRDEIFYFMKKIKIQWFYTAIYAEGFHQSEFSPHRGGAANEKESLHATLFQTIFCQSVILAHSLKAKKLDILIKTDPIDTGIIKKFNKVADTISGLFLRRAREVFKYVPTENPRKFRKEVARISTTTDAIPALEAINYRFVCETSSLTVLADVLANSVLHYLKDAAQFKPGIYLNNKSVLKNHPVVGLSIAPTNDIDIINIIDVVYRRDEIKK